ncbi:MAG TPA: glycosyltransferase [Candidatus Deferrimicrobiaceae bacterium]|nr:glycosyltransferase [Candidatus Deferrimicrobiaceae bacterium]
MSSPLSAYEPIVGSSAITQLRRLGQKLGGIRVVHVNSPREGGGVAEILGWMVPLMRDVGLDASWEVIEGTEEFFEVTKGIHNGLQGRPVDLTNKDWKIFQEVNEGNMERLRTTLSDADIVVVHDPQPSFLHRLCDGRKGKWIWRGHIDISRPFRPVWKVLKTVLEKYDASIFSMCEFAQPLPHIQFLVPPSIDPLSPKNRDLEPSELESVRTQFGLDPERPLLVQISRFDRFKDPVGVIQAYHLVRKVISVQLVLAGGGAADDPEGKAVLDDVLEAAGDDPDIHVISLPPTAHETINALQRLADIILQKSTREGFGLTVTEGMWKGKPVIGGDTGGIRLQVVNHYTGFLVNTPEGAAHRIRYLLHHRERIHEIGKVAREFVRENFLLSRHLREYLTLILAMQRGADERLLEV